MYFFGQTPVEPTGVPIAATIPSAVVEAVVAAVPPVIEASPPPPPPPPTPSPIPSLAPLPSPGASLPASISTGAPAPVDYSMRRGSHSSGHHRPHHGAGWAQPVNVFYTDPTPYYYPQPYPVNYREPQSPVYVIRERNSSSGLPKINWLLVLAVASLLYLIKR